MIQVERVEFYITNVCNLTCSKCNRFNNHNFKGRYDFDIKMYEPWAKKVNFKTIAIMGGEPTLHPKLDEWIENISQLWPHSEKSIHTNGTIIVKKNIHKLLAKHNWTIKLSLHGKKESSFNKDIVQKIQINWGTLQNLQKKDHLMIAETSEGASLQIHSSWIFHDNAFKDQNKFILHDSDPYKAHHYCTMKACHHMIDGKLYKCGVVKLVPDLLKQKKLSYPDLYDDYQPLTVDTITQIKADSLRNDYIPQCKFCPDKKESWIKNLFETSSKKNQ